jgi:hypothetical protein
VAGKEEEIGQLEGLLVERDQQLKRFSEAYGKPPQIAKAHRHPAISGFKERVRRDAQPQSRIG